MTPVHTGAAEPTGTVPVYEMVGESPRPEPLWEEELPARPVRQKLGRLTLGLLVLAFAAGAFYAGVVIEKHSLGSTATTASTRAAAAARTAATPAAGAGGGGGGGATVGQVKLIDGANIYVTDSTGNVVKIATTPASQITVTNTGTVKDVKPGDTVIVTGPTGSDGTVSATAVRDSGAGGAGFGGFGGRAGRGGGGGAAGGPLPAEVLRAGVLPAEVLRAGVLPAEVLRAAVLPAGPGAELLPDWSPVASAQRRVKTGQKGPQAPLFTSVSRDQRLATARIGSALLQPRSGPGAGAAGCPARPLLAAASEEGELL